MIAFVPIARYKVEYQVASGRPFSIFEKLLLRGIDGGSNTLGSLAEMFKVHRRLVIEGLVTLMQAGWVSIAVGSDEFVLSQSGKLACEGSTGLPPTIIVSDRSQTIVVEKVTGQIAKWGSGFLRSRQAEGVVGFGSANPEARHLQYCRSWNGRSVAFTPVYRVDPLDWSDQRIER